CYQYSSGWTF
nr:immunoglobulin light chain junction region [Macaca mulatta]